VVDDLMDDYGAEISAITFVDNYVEFHVKPGATVGQPCAIEFAEPLSGLNIINRTATLAAGKEETLSIRRFPGSLDVEITGGVAVGGKTETTDASVPRPAQWFAIALREALQRAGIVVDGAARSTVWPEATPKADIQLGSVSSPPMRQLIGDFLIPSQNLETDLILAHLGETTRTATTASDKRSDDLGLDELNHFLRKIGVPSEDVIFDEGSGLSRNNLATADATVKLLRFMAQHREAAAYFEGLPSAGKNGTLRRRFKDLPVERNLHAKTGTLRWASALSGYVTTASGEKLAFSLMLNRYVAPSGRRASAELDEVVMKLVQ
jgi:D-alanyl-D-alanine carboxypeptidase/D-alanyl-D-alanine-endopeptidase (penicillin-binding protein 4)